MNSRLKAPLLLCALAACRPDFGLPVSVITEPRIVTVEATPPEGAPGDVVHLRAHVASPDGVADAHGTFAFCTSPRPLTESNIVASDCLGPDGAATLIAENAEVVDATLPAEGCLRFGPETPPQKPGEPPFRPRDPDVTGGYYQPVKVTVGALEAVALVRLRCNLPGASAQRSVEFTSHYVNNHAPTLEALEVLRDGAVLDPLQVPANATLTLRARWAPGTSEGYVVHDRTNDSLVDRREALRVSWYTTGGLVPIVTSGRGEGEEGLDTQTQWQTPGPGRGTLWAVVRDSRGGNSVTVLSFEAR
jgi:hypothetical protein